MLCIRAAVGRVLHALQPVQLPLRLVEEVRDAVAGLRDLPVVAGEGLLARSMRAALWRWVAAEA